MKLSTITRQIKRNLVNSRGWSPGRRIVVVESDDWGSIRMPSAQAYNSLLSKGVVTEKNRYAKYDTLASADDFSHLYETLRSVSDAKGNHPVITANSIMCNPDFRKIEASGYQQYHYESFRETLKRYYPQADIFSLWQQGINESIFYPQLHGREHINVARWMKGLQDNAPGFREAFAAGTFVVDNKAQLITRSESLAAAFNYETDAERDFVLESVRDAYNQFTETFGFTSKTFIAPNYTWSTAVERELAALGVQTLQASIVQNSVTGNGLPNKKVKHHMGERNAAGQYITIRNCYFEPSLLNNRNNAVPNCLKDISNAFTWGRPAIITSHRLNFIGALDESNRIQNLALFGELLRKITKLWPDTEFMNSEQLCDLKHSQK
jgi:hypothetical protein